MGRSVSASYLHEYQKPAFLVDTVDLYYDIHDDYTQVTASYQVKPNPAGSNHGLLELVGKDLSFVSAAIDGQRLSDTRYTVSDELISITGVSEPCKVSITTIIYPKQNKSLSGLYATSGLLVTQCEPQGFRKMTYAIDRPDVSSIFTTTIAADQTKFQHLLSNGNLIESKALNNNRHQVTWHDPHPKPTYLFALVAGNFAIVKDSFTTKSGRKVDLELYTDSDKQQECVFALDALKKSMAWDEQKYGREYDLDRFMIVAAEDFNAGAMENKGLNIFNISYINAHADISTDADFLRVASVVGHEYFHNWSGNRVTCRDWFQLSLKEGLTVYREHQFMEDNYPDNLNRLEVINYLTNHQFQEDASALAHPVQPDSYLEINNFYTATIYNKGAELIRMMEILVGSEAFTASINAYFDRFDGGCATIDDLLNVISETSGYSLQQFKKWYKQKGTPRLAVTTTTKGKEIILSTKQLVADMEDKKLLYPLVIPLAVGIIEPGQQEIRQELLIVDQQEQSFTLQASHEATISLLRGLSAPIIIEHKYSKDQLSTLILHEQDAYVRWDAAMRLFKYELASILASINANKAVALSDVYVKTIQQLLLKESNVDSYGILASLISPPALKKFIEQYQDVEVAKFAKAYAELYKLTYTTLRVEFDGIYDELQFAAPSTATRKLDNAILHYRCSLQDQAAAKFLSNKLAASKSTTDTVNYLQHLVSFSNQEFADALLGITEKWSKHPITFEKLLRLYGLIAHKSVYQHMHAIQQHPKFSGTNPNHVRALFGTFANANLVNLHSSDMQGYQLVLDKFIAIDKFNPQLSSRLMQAFSNYTLFAESNVAFLRQRFQGILKNNISANLLEVASKLVKQSDFLG